MFEGAQFSPITVWACMMNMILEEMCLVVQSLFQNVLTSLAFSCKSLEYRESHIYDSYFYKPRQLHWIINYINYNMCVYVSIHIHTLLQHGFILWFTTLTNKAKVLGRGHHTSLILSLQGFNIEQKLKPLLNRI